RSIGQLRSTGQHSADQQVLLIGRESQNNSGTQVRRREEGPLLEPLFLCQLFAGLSRRSGRCLWHRLNDVRVGQGPTTRRTRPSAGACALAPPAKTSGSTACRNLEQWGLIKINRQGFAITICDRAMSVSKR